MEGHKAPSRSDIRVRMTSWTDLEGKALRARQLEEFLDDWESEPAPPTCTSRVPMFVVLEKDGRSIACGGLLPLEEEDGTSNSAELRRMYVVPEHRGRKNGVADFLIRHLEGLALERGWTKLKLETGVVLERARNFYRRHGYNEIPLYGEYVGCATSVCYEKDLRTNFVSPQTESNGQKTNTKTI